MTVLKRKINKLLCIILCMAILTLSVLPASAAVTFPQGVDEQSAAQSAQKTDALISTLLQDMQGKSLEELVMPMLFSDSTLSQLLTEIYTSLSQNGQTLGDIGIDISPAGVAKHLTAYPSVYERVACAYSWDQVNLDGAVWGVTDKNGFANALGYAFGPFNDILYTLLCSGKYQIVGNLVTLTGDEGYQNAIVPFLNALGCREIASVSDFKSQAGANRYSMVRNIILSVISMLEYVVASPAVRLSEIMPNFAYYMTSGGFSSMIETLISPIKVKLINIIPIIDGSKLLSIIQNSEQISTDFANDPTQSINSMLQDRGIQVAQIDLEKLASCGTLTNGTVTANIAEAYTVIFMWLIDTLKLNQDKLPQLLESEQAGFDTKQMTDMLDKLFSKSTEEIFALLVSLLTATAGTNLDYAWQTPTFTPASITYTPNLTAEKYQRVVDGIDELINEFLAESSDDTIQQLVSEAIYSPELLSKLLIGIYGAMTGEQAGEMLSMIGIKASPKEFAAFLTDKQFAAVRSVLLKRSSWDKVSEDELSWGFKKGDRNGFEAALTAALKPIESMLKMLLVADKIDILGCIGIYGSNGYNTAVIPLLEALGCPPTSILTYDEYSAACAEGKCIQALLDPIFDLVDTVSKQPVAQVLSRLPNILFFISNGSAAQCIINLLTPITSLLEKFGMSLSDMGIDLEEMKNIDWNTTVKELVASVETDIVLPEIDIGLLTTCGNAVTLQSKAVYGGAFAQYTYIQADRPALMVTVLRFLVEVLKAPQNSELLDNMMGGMTDGDGGNNMFATYSSGIGEEMASMSTDETVEWLYKMFFRERAVSKNAENDDYAPTIIYVESKKSVAGKAISSVFLILLLAAVSVCIVKREIIFDRLEERRRKKLKKKHEAEIEQYRLEIQRHYLEDQERLKAQQAEGQNADPKAALKDSQMFSPHQNGTVQNVTAQDDPQSGEEPQTNEEVQ